MVDLIAIVLGVIAVCIGSGIGYLISKKTKLIDNFSKDAKIRNKIINDPELLKEKIKDSLRKLNPDAEGDIKIFDQGREVTLDIKEKDGKKILEINRGKLKEVKVPEVKEKPKEIKPKKKKDGKAKQRK